MAVGVIKRCMDDNYDELSEVCEVGDNDFNNQEIPAVWIKVCSPL
jgi:hypothetical protein